MNKLGYYSEIEPVLGNFIVFGDTHFSNKYSGTHWDYSKNSMRVAKRIVEIVAKQAESSKVSVLILGDIFGVNERNINDESFLAALGIQFGKLNNLCDGRVYCVRGNHDMGDFTTFDFAVIEHWFKNPMSLDYVENGSVEARYHLLNYGREKRPLDIAEGAANIAFGHNNFTIPTVTPWYENEASKWRGDHVELSTMTNLEGVQELVSGHIHTPNIDKNLTEILPNGESIRLYYLGSPSRVSERYNDCYYMTYSLTPEGIGEDIKLFGLWPVEEEFKPDDLSSDEKIIKKIQDDREKKSRETLDEFMNNHISRDVSIKEQILKNTMFTDSEKKLALQYYQNRLDKRSK